MIFCRLLLTPHGYILSETIRLKFDINILKFWQFGRLQRKQAIFKVTICIQISCNNFSFANGQFIKSTGFEISTVTNEFINNLVRHILLDP